MRPEWWTRELQQLTNLCAEPTTIDVRRLPDGRWLVYTRLTFGRTRLCVGRDLTGYEEGW